MAILKILKCTTAAKDLPENDDCELLQRDISKVLNEHHLNKFPVSKKFRAEVYSWLENLFQKQGLSLNAKIFSRTFSSNGEKYEEPEFIFKTFMLNGADSEVTLLEENRDFIGHGTTGLTSWQGSLFLAEWSLRNLELFKVEWTFND